MKTLILTFLLQKAARFLFAVVAPIAALVGGIHEAFFCPNYLLGIPHYVWGAACMGIGVVCLMHQLHLLFDRFEENDEDDDTIELDDG